MKPLDEVRKFKPEVRASDGAPRKIAGYPIVFKSLSEDLGGFRERIEPTAVQFAEDVRADFNHNADFILGRLSAGTLRLKTDATGVQMEVDAPDTTWANDLLASIRRGDIREGSFAFRVLPEGQRWSKDENGQSVRTLTKILVRSVSVVSDPAYTQTSMQVRGAHDVLRDRGVADLAERLARLGTAERLDRLDLTLMADPRNSMHADLAERLRRIDGYMTPIGIPRLSPRDLRQKSKELTKQIDADRRLLVGIVAQAMLMSGRF